MNKISEGVVQGILIAAIGFSAATVWTAFRDSTNELQIAKKQIENQIETNTFLESFNEEQKKTNKSLLELIKNQKSEILSLSESIIHLDMKLKEASNIENIKMDKTIEKKVNEITKNVEKSEEIEAQVHQHHKQQQVYQGKFQQQQIQQQQQQQAWY
jgi:myo-inositol-1-phosphate synthase